MTDDAAIDSARATVESAVGNEGLTGLVNNAGIVVSGPLETLPRGELQRQFDVNLFGQVAVTQAFLPLLRRATGRVVNMSSISGRVTAPLLAPYSMSKFALEAFSDGLRRELLPWGIQVSSVQPGAVATPIWNKALDAPESQPDRLPAGAIELYGRQIDAVRRSAQKASDNAVPAERVADVVHHALFSRRPKTRYLVGPDAKVQAILSRLPTDGSTRCCAGSWGSERLRRAGSEGAAIR